jgi:iron complex outermembrane receptor protein
MLYKDQLVLNGQINDVGSYTRINVPGSYRAGIELQAGAFVSNWFMLNGNVSFSRNKIRSFTEYVDDYDADFNFTGQRSVQHHQTDISFSPNITAAGTVTFIPVKNLQINFVSKYVGRQYLDNTQNNDRMLKGYFTEDLRLNYSMFDKLIFKQVDCIIALNNIFNKMYCPNAYTYPYFYDGSMETDNGYYPAAGFNCMVGVNIRL